MRGKCEVWSSKKITMSVALFGGRPQNNASDTNKYLIYAATPNTVLTTHKYILMDYFNNCNFSKHKLMRSLMTV